MIARVSKESALILVKESKIQGKGVFARTAIPKGTVIIEYTGERISKKEGLRRDKIQKQQGQFYVFALNAQWSVDGATGGDARFINHSCDPNCKYERKDGKIWICALRNIKAGEELTYDYEDGKKEMPCNCGAKNCFGKM
jgi:SET domain-containing protein